MIDDQTFKQTDRAVWNGRVSLCNCLSHIPNITWALFYYWDGCLFYIFIKNIITWVINRKNTLFCSDIDNTRDLDGLPCKYKNFYICQFSFHVRNSFFMDYFLNRFSREYVFYNTAPQAHYFLVGSSLTTFTYFDFKFF